MYPLPVKSKVVVLTDDQGNVKKLATNVDPEIELIVTRDETKFSEAALGQPFVVSK